MIILILIIIEELRMGLLIYIASKLKRWLYDSFDLDFLKGGGESS